jgi:hypothetical protein
LGIERNEIIKNKERHKERNKEERNERNEEEGKKELNRKRLWQINYSLRE